MIHYDIDTINIDQLCRQMGTMEFRDVITRLPYPALVQLHADLVSRVDQIDEWKEEEGDDPSWERRAGTAQRIMRSKANLVAARVQAVERFTLAKLAAQHGGLMGLRDDPRVQARFLLGLVARLVEPSTLSQDEITAVEICRDLAGA